MSVFSVARGISLGALACSLSAPALAEEAEQSRIIVTASPMVEDAATKIVRTPGGVDVVPAEDFGDKLAVSLRDALSFSPGVYTQPRFGQEVRISIRGSDRKSTRLTPVTDAHLVCRLLLDKKNQHTKLIY